MIPLASLLNPAAKGVQSLPSPRETPTPSEVDSASSVKKVKAPKMVKDAAVFVEGKVRQPVQYLPWENYDTDTLKELQAFRVYPLGEISKYHRHIPYNSDKKGFSEKTGRSAFEGRRALDEAVRGTDGRHSVSIHVQDAERGEGI